MRYILDNPDLVRGKRIYDFASGSGIVAIAAALAGARSVTASEIDSFALSAIVLNGEANGVEISVEEGGCDRRWGPGCRYSFLRRCLSGEEMFR